MKDDNLYLIHIDECIRRIESYTEVGRDAFLTSTLIQDAVLRNLQTLGESARRISTELKLAHPDAEWAGVSGFRNVLVHDYMELNMERVWEVIVNDLPTFKQVIVAILDEKGLTSQ
ncbi:MAG: DUF86 domain-containing protein [Chloroflexota bacterium]|nr:DUF86 domain-containing protein [Chloroflexota bacterium]MDQ5865094.1 DUF86 domain-containing protein [Chloroflexota bacterium]